MSLHFQTCSWLLPACVVVHASTRCISSNHIVRYVVVRVDVGAGSLCMHLSPRFYEYFHPRLTSKTPEPASPKPTTAQTESDNSGLKFFDFFVRPHLPLPPVPTFEPFPISHSSTSNVGYHSRACFLTLNSLFSGPLVSSGFSSGGVD
jgi:hypothetical protein